MDGTRGIDGSDYRDIRHGRLGILCQFLLNLGTFSKFLDFSDYVDLRSVAPPTAALLLSAAALSMLALCWWKARNRGEDDFVVLWAITITWTLCSTYMCRSTTPFW